MPSHDPIRHVILLIMENRSFDHMMGGLTAVIPGLDGVDPANPHVNRDAAGQAYFQAPSAITQTTSDPKHEHADVVVQLQNGNSGFVLDFAQNYPASTTEERQQIMDYFPAGFLPGLHSLARDFTVCDRWYSAVPGPTWPNRFFALSGTSLGRILMPNGLTDLGSYFQQTQLTLFDRLNQAGRKWKSYFYDFPSSWLLLRNLLPENLSHYHLIDEFFEDVRDEKSFPEFVFLEPKYFGADENDDHPPHNVMKGEKVIADVYNAIRSNPDLWNNSLLVVFFDEHGGFYDHVTPPGAMAPDDHQSEYAFDHLGLRVPALLISPWVSRTVDHTQFDHTSLLKYLIGKWDLGSLGRRAAAATSIGVALREDEPRTDTVPFIRVSYTQLMPPNPALETRDDSNHHDALRLFAQHLQAQIGATPVAAADAARRMTDLVATVRSGVLGVPTALQNALRAAGL
jgi:phospholipase C